MRGLQHRGQIRLHPYAVTGREVRNLRSRQGHGTTGDFELDARSGKVEGGRVGVSVCSRSETESGAQPHGAVRRTHCAIPICARTVPQLRSGQTSSP